MKNKAQYNINSLPQIAISILIAAVMIGIGATIMVSMQGSQTDSLSAVRNHSVTWPGNNTKYGVGYSRLNTGSIVVYNQTTILTSGTHYTVNSDDTITFTNKSADKYDTTKLNITFQYYYGSYQRNATEYGVLGVDTLGSYVPTISLVAVAAIIIGIIVFMFGRTKPK